MTAVIKSNVAGTASSIYPAGMETYVNRVLADGGQITNFQECYGVFKAIEDAGLTSSQVVAGVGVTCGVKLSGSNVSKLYDFWSSSRDQAPNTAGSTATIDTSSGFPLLSMNAAAGTGTSRASFRSPNPITGVAGAVGFVGSFVLTSPAVSGEVDIVCFEDAAFTRKGVLMSNPLADANNRVGVGTIRSGGPSYFFRKAIYADRMVLCGMCDSVMNAIHKNGTCSRADFSAPVDSSYVGLSLYPSVGSVYSAPAFKFRFGLYLNGAITQAQALALTQSLAALP